MGLPKINAPEYELILPSTEEKIKYRPFLVKEEKILLIAQETGGDKEMFTAVKQICTACTFDKLSFDNMPMFDLEYLFLNIRAKSVGEVVELELGFPGDEEVKVKTSIDLTKIEVKVTEGHTSEIDITDDIKVMMLYPQFDLMALIMGGTDEGETAIEGAFRLVGACMGQIYFGEEMYDAQDQTEEEIQEFLESLTQSQFAKLQGFFETMPKLKHDVVLVHPKTKKKETIVLEGLNSFF
tara:strand:+ start:1290 stop:2006 length:717 start_codon:yes stop_codon:yes gene_type:complete